MIGVNFQPGASRDNGQSPQARPDGVQEAIKVLSLRLPKVVGAQGIAPQPLLSSQGSGGNPRVDSVVNQILSRIMPTGQPQGPSAPMVPQMGPSFGGDVGGGQPQPRQEQQPSNRPPIGTPPHIIVGSGGPPRWPGQATDDGGGPFPGLIGTLPPNFQFPPPPTLPSPWPDLGPGFGTYGSPSGSREDQPLF